MYGCKYCKMDTMRQVEYCVLTGALTNGKMECDCEYELCPEYQKAQEPIKTKPQNSKPKTATQTSIFGAPGEKLIKV